MNNLTVYEPELVDYLQGYVDHRLKPFGFDKATISEISDVEKLKNYVTLIDLSIANGTIKKVVERSSIRDRYILVDKVSTREGAFEIDLLPYFLERKRLVLERINLLQGNEKIENLRDLIKDVSDDKLRGKLEGELAELQNQAQKSREQAEEAEKLQREAIEGEEARLALRKKAAEIREIEWRLWRSFLEKEPVSILVGAILLIIIVVVQLTAMFVHVSSPEIVNSSFLLILGYFFGQSAGRSIAKDKEN